MNNVYCALKLDTSQEPLVFSLAVFSDGSLDMHRKFVIASYGRHLEAGPVYGATEHDAVRMLEYKGN